ncbi:MAG: 50S ribosomal protein L23 [Gammaproteobacteria bacterium]|nr:MAG: 50S ribosomal protein L23 [Gammaproteobacteria bacterium]
MNEARLMQVLLRPHVTEKAALIKKNDQVIFRVVSDATKAEIAAAVELMFEVKVKAVQTSNVKGKARKVRQIAGRRPNWKKAYVSLVEGVDQSSLDFLSAQ